MQETFDSRNELTPCEQFQEGLPALVGAGEDIYRHSHVNACALCKTLVDDLERIAEATRNLPKKRNGQFGEGDGWT